MKDTAPRDAPVPKFGRPLPPGGTVQLVAPAGAFERALFDEGVACLEGLGYRVAWRQDVHDRLSYLAGTARRRAAEIQQAFDDDAVDAVVAVRGGFGCQQVLPLLDWGRIAARPKPFVGCSDLTALLDALFSRAGLVTLHGPMAAGLPGRVDDASFARWLAAITRPDKLPSLQAGGDAYGFCLSPGVARGRARGGSLTLLASLCGTPWQPDLGGAVVFLEDVGEKPYRVERMLVQLRQAGLLDRAAALCLGEFVDCHPGQDAGYRLRDVVDRALRGLPLPVLWDLPFGHGRVNHCFPIGAEVEVDAGRGTVTFREPFVRAPPSGPGGAPRA